MFQGRALRTACQVMERGYRLLASVVTMQLNRFYGTSMGLHCQTSLNSCLKMFEICFACWIIWIIWIIWILKHLSDLLASLSVSTVLSLVLLAVLRPLSQVKGLACARMCKDVQGTHFHTKCFCCIFRLCTYNHTCHAEYGLRFD